MNMNHRLARHLLTLSLAACTIAAPLTVSAATAPADTAAPAAATTATQAAPANPSCVVMKFTDDTRFKNMGSDERITEFFMDALLKDGKFNLKAQTPVSQDMNNLLYNDRRPEIEAAKKAVDSGDLNAVFEGPAFHDDTAQTLSTAAKGQHVATAVTTKLGKESGADYLIQGTIVQIGQGEWKDNDVAAGVAIAQAVMSYIPGASRFSGLLGGVSQTDAGFSVLADLRVIEASTGRVVWTDRVQKLAGKSHTNFIVGSSGSTDLSESDYVKALQKAANALAKDLNQALENKTLFVD